MSTTILTYAQIEQGRIDIFGTDNPFCPCDSKTMRKAARWTEQAVLQSPEVQAWKRDAERYRKVRRMTLIQYSDLYTHCSRTGAHLDSVLDISNDAAMEKQP